jgi:hypothetical protein
MDEVRSLILSERTALAAFADVGIRDDQAPPAIARQVARVNELLAEITPLIDEIAAACGAEDDDA